MASMIGVSACFRCRKVFQYNIDLVPTVEVTAADTDDESLWGYGPLCERCMGDINHYRIHVLHLPPNEINPNAYRPGQI